MDKGSQVTYADIAKELNIPRNRYDHIMSYVIQMITDYRANIADIIKEIPLNLKGKERYFTMFIMGHSSYPTFNEANDEEREKFIVGISDALKLSQERAGSITQDTEEAVIKEIEKQPEPSKDENIVPTIDIIKQVIDSNFADKEKDYIVFVIGLIYT